MAIVIPSKEIHKEQNSKVLDNVIERIEVSAKSASITKEYGVTVATDVQEGFNTDYAVLEPDSKEYLYEFHDDPVFGNLRYTTEIAYAAFKDARKLNAKVIIPISQNQKRIEKVYTGENKDNEPYITYAIRGKVEKGEALASWGWTAEGGKGTINEGSISYSQPTEENEQYFDIQPSVTSAYDRVLPLEATAYIGEKSNVKTATARIETINEVECYVLDFEIVVEVIAVSLNHYDIFSTSYPLPGWPESALDLIPNPLPIKGEYTRYKGTRVEIMIKGDTTQLDMQDATVYINGDTAKKVESFSGNELMQMGGEIKTIADNSLVEIEEKLFTDSGINYRVRAKRTTSDTSYGLEIQTKTYLPDIGVNRNKTFVIPEGSTESVWSTSMSAGDEYKETFEIISVKKVRATIKYMYGNTLKQYEKGKETATVACYFSDYYDDVRVKKNTLYNMHYKDDTFIVLNESAHSICLQYYGDDDTYQDRGEIVPINGEGKYSFKFTKANGFSRLGIRVFVYSGAYTAVTFDASNLINGEEYTAILNITKLDWNELRFTELRVVKKSISIDNSTGKMHFDIGDKVIPMVCDINRNDKPMSFYEDGTPKVFEVLGVDFVYDGEPLQRLHLQEAMLDSE